MGSEGFLESLGAGFDGSELGFAGDVCETGAMGFEYGLQHFHSPAGLTVATHSVRNNRPIGLSNRPTTVQNRPILCRIQGA